MDPKDNTNPNLDVNADVNSNAVPVNIGDATAAAADATADIAANSDDNPNITIDSARALPQDPETPKKTFADIKPAAPVAGSIGSAASGPVGPAPVTPPASDDVPVTDDQSAADTPDSIAPVDGAPKTDDAPATDQDEPKKDDAPAPEKSPAVDPAALIREAESTSAAHAPEPDPVVALPTKKSSRHLSLILSIGFILLLVAACVVLTIMLVQSNERAKNTTVQKSTSTSTSASLVCAEDVTAKENEALQTTVTSAKNTKTFVYENGDLSNIVDETQITFDSAATASAQVDAAKAAYQSLYAAAGLSEDPFDTSIAAANAVVTVKHELSGEKLNAKTLNLLDLKTNETGDLDKSQNFIKKQLESAGYVCAAAQTETTTNTY